MRNSLSAWHRCLTVKCNMWEGIFQVSSSVSASLTSAITSFLFPPAPNPCAQVDGSSPCSHLCLINFNQTFSCACPHLMKLQPDKRTCKGQEETERPPVDPSKKPRLYLQLSFTAAVCEVVSFFFHLSLHAESRKFLLYARQIEIRGVDIDNPYYNYIISFTVPDIDNVTVVDYDAVEHRIYWSDVRTQTIKRAFINGTGVETVVSAGDLKKGFDCHHYNILLNCNLFSFELLKLLA